MTRHFIKPSKDNSSPTPASLSEDTVPQTTVMSDILCIHNQLDPTKANSMKRISEVGLSLHLLGCLLTRSTHLRRLTRRSPTHSLLSCLFSRPIKSAKLVSRIISTVIHTMSAIIVPWSIHHFDLERLYQIEHPQIVAQFDEVNEMEQDSSGYWISKPWLKGRWLEI
jgi:hypothetical protein